MFPGLLPSTTAANTTSITSKSTGSKVIPNWSITLKFESKTFWGAAPKPSVKEVVATGNNVEPPDVSFKIKSFKSCIKPVVVVSQNISKLDTTGSVSYTDKYCIPGTVRG